MKNKETYHALGKSDLEKHLMCLGRYFILFLCMLFSFFGQSQRPHQHHIDSLHQEILKNPSDTVKVNLLLTISRLASYADDLIAGKQNANQAYALADSIGYDEGKIQSLAEQGKLYWMIDDNRAALDCNLQALAIGETLGRPKLLTSIYTNLCHDYIYFEAYDSSMIYIEKAIKINAQFGDEHLRVDLIGLRGYVYMRMKEYQKAEKDFLVPYNMGVKNKDSTLISAFAADLGILLEKQGRFKEALKYGKIALNSASSTGNKRLINQAYKNIEPIYLSLKDYKNAYESLSKRVEIGMEQDNTEFLSKINEMEMSLDFEKEKLLQKTAQEKKDFQQRIIRNSIGALLLLALLSIVNFYRQSKNLKAEKATSESLLLNILPESIANELKTKGHAEVQEFEQVSVLFTDFIDFTAISEQFNSAELVAEINVCYKAFDLICEKYTVEKIKTIGDSYMAVGGIPTPTPQSTKHTVLAALEMQRFIEDRKLEQDRRGKIAFSMRVGIHTGPIVAGIVGLKKFQYDIWGDTVNTASRIESNSAEGQVNISKTTYEGLMKDTDFAFEKRGQISVKGKGDLEMWFVT